jgi:hypothetical protein
MERRATRSSRTPAFHEDSLPETTEKLQPHSRFEGRGFQPRCKRYKPQALQNKRLL